MTGEVKGDGRRSRRFHQRSKSSIGDYTSPLQHDSDTAKPGSESGKVIATVKDHSRSWFKSSKKPSHNPESAAASDAEDLDLQKQPFRVVQGVYRDDDGGPSPKILVTSHSAARNAVKEFAKDFIAHMKSEGSSSSEELEAQMRQSLNAPPSTELKFVVQAYIAHHLFTDFENASFGIPNPGEKPWEVQDHMRRCFAQFQKLKTKSQTVSLVLEHDSEVAFLSQFCAKKLRAIATIVPSGALLQEDSPFYRSFLGAAVSVWLLQRLAFSFEQKIVPIVPASGDAFQRRFMTPVVPGTGDDVEDSTHDHDEFGISFTVFPGFRVSESVVESLVYIVDRPKLCQDSTTTPVTPGVVKLSKASTGGEHSLLQKIRSKFTRKKTLVKGTSVAESNNGTMTPPPPTPPSPTEQEEKALPAREDAALPLEEESTSPVEEEQAVVEESDEAPSPSLPNETVKESYEEEAPNSSSAEEMRDSYVASSSPYSLGIDDDNRLYIPRAQKLLHSPLRSPRLSSVD